MLATVSKFGLFLIRFFDILVHPRKYYTHDRPAKIHPKPATIYLWPATIYAPPRRLDSLLPLMLFYDLVWYQYYYFDMICFVNCLKWVFVSVWCNVKQCRLFVCLLLSFYKAFFQFLRIYSEESGFQILLMQTNKKPLRFCAEFPISFHYPWAFLLKPSLQSLFSQLGLISSRLSPHFCTFWAFTGIQFFIFVSFISF